MTCTMSPEQGCRLADSGLSVCSHQASFSHLSHLTTGSVKLGISPLITLESRLMTPPQSSHSVCGRMSLQPHLQPETNRHPTSFLGLALQAYVISNFYNTSFGAHSKTHRIFISSLISPSPAHAVRADRQNTVSACIR